MGRNKAFLEINGEPLIARALRSLAQVCGEVAIAGGAPELSRFGRVIVDPTPGCGPLGGIVPALEQTTSDWNIFVPVDVPFIPSEAWERLLAAAKSSPAAAVMARAGGQVQPLCAVYHRRALPVLRQELDAGHWKVTAAVAAAGGAEYVDFVDAAWFKNFNTPEEFSEIEPGSAHQIP